MNIFYLDHSPKVAAQYHVDSHVVKMILETAQLLSTAHRIIDGKKNVTTINRKKTVWTHPDPLMDATLYKATHVNHPSAVWVRESKDNYEWTYSLFCELCDEYSFRYGKVHMTDQKLRHALKAAPSGIPNIGKTPVAQAMPDYCKDRDPIQAYRHYYAIAKRDIHRYTKRKMPVWLTNSLLEIDN